MVTRKPVAQAATADAGVPAAENAQNMTQNKWSASESDNADDVWASERQDQIDDRQPRTIPPEDIPDALRPGMPPPANYSSLETEENVWGEPTNTANPTNTGETEQRAKTDVNRVPTVLRPGGVRPETNPFKRKPPGSAPSPRRDAAVEPPTSSFAQLSVEESNSNPWEPAVEDTKPGLPPQPPVLTVTDTDSGRDIWDSGKPSRQPTPGPSSTSPALVSVPSESGSAVWDEKQPIKARESEEKIALGEEQELEDSHIWDDLGALDKGKGPEKQPSPLPSQSTGGRIDEWSLIDHDAPPAPAPLKRQDTWENFDETPDAEDSSASPQHTPEEEAPSLPPRAPTGQAALDLMSSPQPPRQVAEPKNQTYQIKVINWHDTMAPKNPRQSPILVQNANGPCPLVALVNALTLTTPAELDTALVETLRTREQVSLSLVIDAVFDELMSSRRTNPDAQLPDVAELYDFLKGLHTGMNVNPRFVPEERVVKAFKRTSLTHLHPSERDGSIPGTFEETREMVLYSTFQVPLIHGWLPSKGDAVYAALERRAASYEDVQNLLFMEEELDDKLSSAHHQGLTEEEQAVYQDILTIKSFLHASATQLTPWGLQTIRQAMKPGSVAILFRNDHFSTLYRHPHTHELLTLVTDAGYATHEEVVWESLVDVNGEHAEFFSGDLRVVGGASHRIDQDNVPARGSSSTNNNAWTTVGRRGRTQTQNTSADDAPPLSPTHEQEDRDLALAMQLQEEEDERARAEEARRRRESQLSEQYIEQQGRQPGGGRNPQNAGGRGNGRNNNNNTGRRSTSTLTPTPTNASTTSVNSRASAGRGGGRAAPQSQTVRSLIPPRGGTAVNRAADEGEDEAPPSYEQAAKAPAYVPPADGGNAGAGASASAASAVTQDASQRRTSAASAAAPRPSMLNVGSDAPGPGQMGTPGGGGRTGSTSNYPGAYPGSGRTPGTPTGQRISPNNRQGVPMGATRVDGRDRDCVVM